MTLHTLSDNVAAVIRPQSERHRLLPHHSGAGQLVALEHDEMVALGRLIAEVLDGEKEEERPANEDGIALREKLVIGPRTYHLDCAPTLPYGVELYNVSLLNLHATTCCDRCGGSIHKAALLDE